MAYISLTHKFIAASTSSAESNALSNIKSNKYPLSESQRKSQGWPAPLPDRLLVEAKNITAMRVFIDMCPVDGLSSVKSDIISSYFM